MTLNVVRELERLDSYALSQIVGVGDSGAAVVQLLTHQKTPNAGMMHVDACQEDSKQVPRKFCENFNEADVLFLHADAKDTVSIRCAATLSEQAQSLDAGMTFAIVTTPVGDDGKPCRQCDANAEELSRSVDLLITLPYREDDQQTIRKCWIPDYDEARHLAAQISFAVVMDLHFQAQATDLADYIFLARKINRRAVAGFGRSSCGETGDGEGGEEAALQAIENIDLSCADAILMIFGAGPDTSALSEYDHAIAKSVEHCPQRELNSFDHMTSFYCDEDLGHDCTATIIAPDPRFQRLKQLDSKGQISVGIDLREHGTGHSTKQNMEDNDLPVPAWIR